MLTSTTQQQLLGQKKQTKTQLVENDPYCEASTTTRQRRKKAMRLEIDVM
jgi:hypothetical protein